MSDPTANWLKSLAGLPARMLVLAVRAYQFVVSPVLPAVFGPACGCRFHPTCSHYAVEAVRRHGAGRGAWLAVRRLLKCTPLHPGGFDPVPARRARAVPSVRRVTATPALQPRRPAVRALRPVAPSSRA